MRLKPSRKSDCEKEPLQVDVLLATFNGAQYLEEQLESLWAQTFENFRLLVSDDGSTDGTVAILERFERRWGHERFKWITNAHVGGGPLRNFEALMRASASDGVARWIAFCDQDDVWLPQKLTRLVEAMSAIESGHTELPCLVHSDLRVVDQQLQTIADSFVAQQGINPLSVSQQLLFSVNHVTGCAMMINQALLAMALPVPSEVVMHDWWCALLSCAGRRRFIPEPLVLYRQHGANQVGAKSRALSQRVWRVLHDGRATIGRVRQLGRQTASQTGALAQRLSEAGLDDSVAQEYIRWRQEPLWKRAARYGCYYRGPALDNWCRLLLW